MTLFLAATAATQPPPLDPTPEQRVALNQLRRQITASNSEDTPIQVVVRLREALAPFPHSSDADVLALRSQAGTFALLALRPRIAITEFRSVLERGGKRDLDLGARALYGLAQAHDLLGEDVTAKRYLNRLLAEYEGTTYADYARSAQARIEKKPIERKLAVGRPAPVFEAVLDLRNRSVTLEALLAKTTRDPILLVFWSPGSDTSVNALERLSNVWRKAGLPSNRLLAFALEREPDAIEQAARKLGLDGPVIPCERVYASPVAMQYGVDAIPAHFLIGADGTLLSRNPPPHRLESILQQIAKR